MMAAYGHSLPKRGRNDSAAGHEAMVFTDRQRVHSDFVNAREFDELRRLVHDLANNEQKLQEQMNELQTTSASQAKEIQDLKESPAGHIASKSGKHVQNTRVTVSIHSTHTKEFRLTLNRLLSGKL